MNEEVWKEISGYGGKYLVSNYGNVIKKKGDKIRQLKPHIAPYGYLRVSLRKEGKSTGVPIHRLVAEAFIPNPNNYPQINHKDVNPSNNCWTNLEWCTPTYNIRYSKAKKVQSYFHGLLIKEYEALIDVKKDGYNFGNVAAVCKGKRKTAHGLEWKYAK